MKRVPLIILFIFSILFAQAKEINWEQSFAKLEYSYQLGDYKAGMLKVKDLEEEIQKTFGAQSLASARLKAVQAKYQWALGNFVEYKKLCTQASQLITSVKRTDDTDYLRALSELIEARIIYLDAQLAEKLLDEAFRIISMGNVKDRYVKDRLNYLRAKNHFCLGYYNQVLKEIPSMLAAATESLTNKEVVLDAKGKEKEVKYSPEEELLRNRVYAAIANIEAQTVLENGEYAQAMLLLENNQEWIQQNIKTKEGAFVEAVYLQAMIALDKEDYYEAEKKLRKAETVAAAFLRPYSNLYMVVEEALIPTLKLLEKNKEAQLKNEEVDAKVKSYFGTTSFAFQRNNLIDTRRHILNHDWKLAERELELFLLNKELVPTDHNMRALALQSLYDLYMHNNKIELAEKCLLEAVEILKLKLGEKAPVYHMALLKLAEHYVLVGDQYTLSEKIYKESLDEIVKKEVGHKHRQYAYYIYGEIKLHLLTDRFDKAKAVATAILAETEQYHSQNSVPYAVCLEKYAGVDIEMGKYNEADAKLIKAYKLLDEKGMVKDRLSKAHVLESQARLQILQGLFDEAGVTLRKADKLTRRSGDTDISFSTTSEEITELNIYLGKYGETEEFLNEMLNSRIMKYGPTSSSLIHPLNLLGYLYFLTGDYVEAEKTMEKALLISKNKFGEQSSKYAESLKLLERLYASVGDYEKAEKLGLRVTEIATRVYGVQHVWVAQAKNELALVKHFNKKDKEEVEPLIMESLKSLKSSLGETSPMYAEALENAAVFYLETERLSIAIKLLNEANAVWLSRLGETNAHTARISYLQGDIQYLQKKYKEANDFFLKSKNIYSMLFDNMHPGYVEATGRSAQMYYCLGDIKNAVASAEETVEKSMTYLDKVFPTLSERGKAQYWEKAKNDFEFYKTLAFTQSATYPDMVGKVYTMTLKTKAILLNSTIKVKERIMKSGDTSLVKNYQTWINNKEELASLLSLSASQRKETGIDISKLENDLEELEKKLSARSDLFANEYEKKILYEWRELKKVIKENEAAIEIISFRLYDKNFSDSVWYAALSITQDSKSNPDFVLLKNGRELNTKYLRYFRNCTRFEAPDEYSYDMFWKPIDALIKKGNTKIYLSCDGVYNQLNPEVLSIPGGGYLLDRYTIVLVSSTRDLLERAAAKRMDKSKTATKVDKSIKLFGNPIYYPNEVEESQRSTKQLPGAAKEAKQIAELMQKSQWATELFVDQDAGEDKVKKINSPRVFHIATHGFFLSDATSADLFDEFAQKAVQNPLLRSGLLLKNGGYLLSTDNINEFNREDGILTAYEAMNLGLDNTELVVLSACETGLGELKMGEGVYGLQRSFLVAGSDAVMMSLFKVSDEVTTELMILFYTKWINNGDKRKAFAEAKKEIKIRYPSPKYWGAFIMIGVE